MDPYAAHIDFETRSPTDLRKSGAYRYAEDPNTGTWCMSWRIGVDGPVNRWHPGDPDPQPLLNHVASGGTVVAHNAAFERAIWNRVVRVRYAPHWPKLWLQQQDCTMARAAAVAHPQKLDTLCRVAGADHVKDQEGAALMMKMARPRGWNNDGTIIWWDSEENKQRLGEYCDTDVLTESSVDEKIPPLTDSEKQVWMFDQTINDRGINIDVQAAAQCAELVEFAKKKADSLMRRITSRQVPRCSNDAKMVAWINSHGLDFDTVKKGVTDDIIFMAGLKKKQEVIDAIKLRAASKKTSTAKYKAMLACVCEDGRIRGLLNYHGASTGRWAGRLVQPQNFPRVDYDMEGVKFEWLQHMFHSDMETKDIYERISAVYGENSVLVILSRALRSMICAPEGKQLIGGDFSNIEGRKNAWLAGEEWKLQAFQDYDDGVGQDLYKLAFSKSMNVPVEEVDDWGRQVGKVQELACGYQGSIGAYVSMADNYGITPYDFSGPVYETTAAEVWDMTASMYEGSRNKYGLQEKEWTAIKIIVDGWRKANSKIVESWWEYQDAAIEAAAAPGHAIKCANGRVTYFSDGRCLWCVLPSGRMLCYSAPEVEREEYTYMRDGEERQGWRRKVTFWGMDGTTKQWRKNSLYGGLQCENIVQAASRDLMVDRMVAIEAAGYPIVLTVHDEIVAETPLDRSDLNAPHFEQLMSVKPSWAEGLPLSVKAWEHERYVK